MLALSSVEHRACECHAEKCVDRSDDANRDTVFVVPSMSSICRRRFSRWHMPGADKAAQRVQVDW